MCPSQGLGCFLAWSVRTVSSKRLTLSMFAVTVFSVSGAAGSLLTSHNPPVHFCLSGVLIVCCNAVMLALLLGPKVGVASSLKKRVIHRQIIRQDVKCFLNLFKR